MSRALVLSIRLRRVLAAARQQRGAAMPRLDFENPDPKPALLGIVLLCAGLLLCAAVALRIELVGRENAQLAAVALTTSPLAAPTAARSGQTIAGPGLSKAAAQRADQANAIIARLSMPWDAWFSQLESAANGKVVLTSLQPEAEGRRVRLSGEARRFDDLVDYMMKLEATPGFGHVFLTEHAEPTPGTSAVSFTLTADWVGAL